VVIEIGQVVRREEGYHQKITIFYFLNSTNV
jgi:hypothetical protein